MREAEEARLEGELIGKELAKEDPRKTIPVKVILPLLERASACYIPRYVFLTLAPCLAQLTIVVYDTAAGNLRAAFLKSCANIPSHVDDLLARPWRVVYSISMRRQRVVWRTE